MAARFLIEEDEEQMRKELKEAFRFYDKEGESSWSLKKVASGHRNNFWSHLLCLRGRFLASRIILPYYFNFRLGLPDHRHAEGHPVGAGADLARFTGLNHEKN